MKLFPPMLSASLDGVDLQDLKYPKLVSAKLDGIRGIVWEGTAYSRNGKPIRNHFVQQWAKGFHAMDGEFIVGSPTEPLCLNRTHAIMAIESEPDFKFYLFDTPGLAVHMPFCDRLALAHSTYKGRNRIVCHEHQMVHSATAVEVLEEYYNAEGYEGIMARDPLGPYKNGYSTLREEWLLKLKRFVDGEAVVTALEMAMENTNPLEKDEMGYAKRSTHKANLIPKGMVGTILAEDPKWGHLKIAPGIMTHEDRVRCWKMPHLIIGKTIHWRSFGYGIKDKPRFARFYGIRIDL